MEHFISRVVFWIVMLFLGLRAKSLPIDITDSNIELMREHVKCLVPGSTFYTPSNIEENCIAAALDCFFRELKGTVKLECNDPEEYIDGAIEFSQRVTKRQERNLNNNATASQCYCESWPQAPFDKFLDELERLYQRLNVVGRTSESRAI